MKRVLFISLAFYCALSVASGFSWADDQAMAPGEVVQLKGGYLIAGNKRTLIEAIKLEQGEDSDTLSGYMETGKVKFTEDGEHVEVLNLYKNIGIARVAVDGNPPVRWTEIEALRYADDKTSR